MATKTAGSIVGKKRGGYEEWFGWHQARLRSQAGWTWYQLAERLAEQGYPLYQAALKSIEHGERAVKLNDAIAIAQALNVDLDDMLEPPTPQQLVTELEKAADNRWVQLVLEHLTTAEELAAERVDWLHRTRDRAQRSSGAEDPAVAGAWDDFFRHEGRAEQAQKALAMHVRQLRAALSSSASEE